MNQNSFWKWALVVFIAGWAISEIYPPSPRNLVEEFQAAAANKDTNFTAIIARAKELEAVRPTRNYANLRDAVGTNDITRHFPQFKLAANENDATRAILNRLQQQAAGKIRLGLDLQGGTQFVVRLQHADAGGTNATDVIDRQIVVDQAVEVLRKRVDRFGVAEPVIQPAGEDRILIQLPGLAESEILAARNTIERAAFLEFRMVHPESDMLISQGLPAPGHEKLFLRRREPNGQETVTPYLVRRKPEQGLIGKYVSRAGVIRDPVSNRPQISLEFDSKGTELFGEVTKNNVGRFLAIVLDGELYSAPRINEPIPGGSAVINGDFDLKEAFELANVLENPLEAPLKVEEQRGVDPSLGKDSVASGMRASAIAAALTFCFMGVFYFLAGMVANLALILNVLILLGVMCSMDSTLTLPGIAGIALTIGMAVDANVLIFERLREELAKGKTLKGALAAGYDRAFGPIFDSHVTTLITSAILYWQGTGPIKGFGVTLFIGVAASLFTALFVTRLVFNFLLSRNLIQSLKMLPIIKVPSLNFLGGAKFSIIASAIVIAVGVGFAAVRSDRLLGVDFAGGDGLTFRFEKRVDVDQLRQTITELNQGEPLIQYQRSIIDESETLNILTAFDGGPKVEAALKAKYPESNFRVVATDKVGPSVGQEIQRSAVIASILALFGILFYVALRYEFGFAVAAVLATFHDVLITMGIFFLTGRELSSPMVAAVLTIIGYSINDKIVILDRIREDLKLGVRGSFRDIINLALNQTLSRTLITGGSVMLATLSLYVFGGGVINDFAFTFLVGIVAGTYSSIFIASPAVLWWYKGERPGLASTVVVDQQASAHA